MLSNTMYLHDIACLQDELTLDNISRSGLVNMCRYMGLPGFGSDSFLRFQLRSTLRAITEVPSMN